MTLQQLRYVVAVHKAGSFSAASEDLYVSQPSISTMIADLEEELNITIFNRSKKGVELTEDGKVLLQYAYSMLHLEDEINYYFKTKKDIVAFSVSSQHYTFAIDAFLHLEEEYDHLKYNLALKETRTSQVIEDVAKSESEIGIIQISSGAKRVKNRIFSKYNIEFFPLITTKTSVFIAKDHPLANNDFVTPEDLANYPCIVYDQSDDPMIYFSEEIHLPDYLSDKIISISDLYTSVQFIKEQNAYNIGSGIISPHLDEMTEITSVPLVDDIPFNIGYITLRNANLSTIAKRYLEILKEELGKYTSIKY